VGQKSTTILSGLKKSVYEFLIQTNPLNPGTIIALIDFGRNINTSMVQFSGGVNFISFFSWLLHFLEFFINDYKTIMIIPFWEVVNLK
jgi:hypothetical protein